MFEIVARELRAKLLGRRRGQGGLRDDALSHTQQHSTAGVEGAGGTGGPGCGARGQRQGLAGTTQYRRRRRCGGRRRVRRARAGFEIDHSEPSGSRVAISRAGRRPRAHTAAGPQSSTTERPEHQRCHTATTCSANGERAGRRPRAHQAARPDESGPTAPGTPAARQTALTRRRRRAPGVPCS